MANQSMFPRRNLAEEIRFLESPSLNTEIEFGRGRDVSGGSKETRWYNEKHPGFLVHMTV